LHNHQKRATKTKFINGVGVPIWNCDDLTKLENDVHWL